MTDQLLEKLWNTPGSSSAYASAKNLYITAKKINKDIKFADVHKYHSK